MEETYIDMNHELTLDANAVAGLLQEIFGTEMTTVPSECAGCGNQAEVGSLLAYVHSPGYILRCSVCKQVVMRIVETSDSFFVDARGAAYLRLRKH
jgi:hypothetical protein